MFEARDETNERLATSARFDQRHELLLNGGADSYFKRRMRSGFTTESRRRAREFSSPFSGGIAAEIDSKTPSPART